MGIGTSVVFVFEYLIGLAIFGLIYWILNGILDSFWGYGTAGELLDLAHYLWAGILIIYLIFGIYYLIIKIKTWQVFGEG